MTQEQLQPLQEHDKEEWRQFLLAQLIGFLEQNEIRSSRTTKTQV